MFALSRWTRGRRMKSKRCRSVGIRTCATSSRSTGSLWMQQSVRNTPAPQQLSTAKCIFLLHIPLTSSIKAKIRGEEPPTELPADYAASFEESPQDRLRSKFGEDGLGNQVGFHDSGDARDSVRLRKRRRTRRTLRTLRTSISVCPKTSPKRSESSWNRGNSRADSANR